MKEELKVPAGRVVRFRAGHPHAGEIGVATGKYTDVGWHTMSEYQLEDCEHGVDRCYANWNQVHFVKPRANAASSDETSEVKALRKCVAGLLAIYSAQSHVTEAIRQGQVPTALARDTLLNADEICAEARALVGRGTSGNAKGTKGEAEGGVRA